MFRGPFRRAPRPAKRSLCPSLRSAFQLSADAVLTGLVINMDGGVNLNNDGDGTFFIRGAVMSTGDVRFTNNGNVGL